MLPAQTNTAEWERLFSTTKCCIPARKSGKSENSPEAPTVIVGLEVDDAETIGKPQWDGIGPGFVWINTFRDYVVCQSTATCFRLFKHWGCFSLKLHRNEKKGKKPNSASTCWKRPPWRVIYCLESWHFACVRKEGIKNKGSTEKYDNTVIQILKQPSVAWHFLILYGVPFVTALWSMCEKSWHKFSAYLS